MGLTQVSTDGVKNDAITKTKIPANQIEASELADNAVDTNAIADQAVALSKLPHGDGSSDGKFLRANNGADPTFETVSIPAGTTINNNADNRVITGSGTANTLEGEANLTFNGQKLNVVANDGGQDVNFAVRNTNATGFGAYISGGGTAQYILRLDNKDQSEKVRFPSTGGISFNGDTAAANALDDYEEGTWTPTAHGYTGSNTSNNCFYTKIGRLVIATFRITWPSLTSSASAEIRNLPFTCISQAVNTFGGAFAETNDNDNLHLIVQQNTTKIYILRCTSSGVDTQSITEVSGKDFRGNIIYFTNQ